MQLPSLQVLESWPAPNYNDPIHRGPGNVIITLVFLPFMYLVVAVRLYTRLRITRSFCVDDVLIIIALIPTTAFAILALLYDLYFHLDRHIWDVPPDEVVVGLKLTITSIIIFSISTHLTKLSMLTLVRRVVPITSNFYRRAIEAAMLLVVLQLVSFTLTVLFQCRSPAAYWTLTFTPQKCISETKNLLAAGIINSATDIIVVLLPMPAVWKLHLPVQQQIVVALLFSGGIVVTIAGSVRTFYLYQDTIEWDKTWNAWPVYMSSAVELYLGVICASIPATKRFFSKYAPRVFGRTHFTISTTCLNSKFNEQRGINKINSLPSMGDSWTDNDVDMEMYSYEVGRNGRVMTGHGSGREILDSMDGVVESCEFERRPSDSIV